MNATTTANAKLTADDPRYGQMFDVQHDGKKAGIHVEREYSDEMNRLRDAAPIMKGSLRSLLGLDEIQGSQTVDREDYTIFSFKACERAFRENLIFSSEIIKESLGMQMIGTTFLQMIGEEHRCQRAVVQPLFLRPKVVKWWKPRWIDDTVDTLLNALQGQETADLNLSLCARMPMYVVTRAIGLEGEDALNFREHLTRSTFGARYEKPETVAASRIEVDAILQNLIDQRRRTPGDDVISGVIANDLVTGTGEPLKLTDQQIFSFCKLLIFAGGGTTWRQMGITIDALMTHYHFWEECVADRSLIERAVDETLRWRATDPIFWRLATSDVEVEGLLVPKGARVGICLGAANRDPAIWDQPDEFDIHRRKHHHLGTGIGPHRCLGMDVAKQEMVSAINGLMDRWPNMRPDETQPKAQFIGLEHRGMSAVPVRLR